MLLNSGLIQPNVFFSRFCVLLGVQKLKEVTENSQADSVHVESISPNSVASGAGQR